MRLPRVIRTAQNTQVHSSKHSSAKPQNPTISDCNWKQICRQDASVRVSIPGAVLHPQNRAGLISLLNTFRPPPPYNTCTVFVTGNAGKLREVREILTNGPQPIEIESHSIDCEFPLGYNPFGHREMKH